MTVAEPANPLATRELKQEIEATVRTASVERLLENQDWLRATRMAGEKAFQFVVRQAVDSMTRCLTDGLISMTIEELDKKAVGSGSTKIKISLANKITILDASKQPWGHYTEFVVRAGGFEVATFRLTFELVPKFSLIDAAFTQYSDGGCVLTLGKARLECDIRYRKGKVEPGVMAPAPILLGTIKRDFTFNEPFVIRERSAAMQSDPEGPACPYGLDATCPARSAREESPPAPGVSR